MLRAVAHHGLGWHGGLAFDQRGLGATIAGLRDVVQLRVNLDVAGGHGAFGIGKKLDPPIVLGDAELLARSAAAQKRLARFVCVPFRHTGIEGALRVVFDEVLHAGKARIIVGMQVNAEEAGQEDAISHLQPPAFHVANQFVNNGLSADPRGG